MTKRCVVAIPQQHVTKEQLACDQLIVRRNEVMGGSRNLFTLLRERKYLTTSSSAVLQHERIKHRMRTRDSQIDVSDNQAVDA